MANNPRRSRRVWSPTLFAVLSVTLLSAIIATLYVVPRAEAASGTITFGSSVHDSGSRLEQQATTGDWTPGEIAGYSELDQVPFRFAVTLNSAVSGAPASAAGSVSVVFDRFHKGSPFWEPFIELDLASGISSVDPPIPFPTLDGDKWIVTFHYDFENEDDGHTVQTQFRLRLSDTSASGTGVAQVRMSAADSPGDFSSAGLGAKTVNIQVSDVAPVALITVRKELEPADSGTFDLLIDGTVIADDVGDGASSGPVVAAVDMAHIVGEAFGDGSKVVGFATAVSCVDDSGHGSVVAEGDGVTSLELPAALAVDGANIVCTFTNTAQAGSITIIKNANPDDGQDFAFNGDLGGGSFSLNDDGDETDNPPTDLPSGRTFSDLALGDYDVTEQTVAGWDLTGIDCGAATTTSINGGDGVRIILDGGEAVSCTFTNVKQPTPTPRLAIVKHGEFNDEDGDGFGDVGETITYTFVVTNTGNVTLHNILVTDPMVSPITFTEGNPIPELAPGAQTTGTGTYTLTQGDIDAGQKENTVTAQADEVGPVTDTAVVPVPGEPPEPPGSGPQPGMMIDKEFVGNADEDGSGDVTLGDTLTYKFTVTNTGDVTLTHVTVNDPLTGDLVNLAPEDDVNGDGVGTLQPGAVETGEVDYVVTQADVDAGQVANTATGDSDQTGPVIDTVTVPVEPAEPPEGEVEPVSDEPIALPGIDIELATNSFDADTPGLAVEVMVGSVVVWTYIVTNAGEVELTNVTVVDDNGTPDDASDDITIATGLTLSVGESVRSTTGAAAASGSEQFQRAGVAVSGLFGKSATATAAEGVSDIDPSFYFGTEAGELLPVGDEPIDEPPDEPPASLPNTGSGGLADANAVSGGVVPLAIWVSVSVWLAGIGLLVAHRARVAPRSRDG